MTVLSPPLRALVVEDVPSTQRFLRAVLGSVSSLDIVGEAGSGYDAVRMAHALSPDLVLLDLSLPDANGADLLAELLSRFPSPSVVVLSGTAEADGPRLVAQGATGFISKGLPPVELVRQLSVLLGVPLSLAPVGGGTSLDAGAAAATEWPPGEVFEPAVVPSALRVLIVEDVPSSLSMLRSVLGCVPSLEVVGEAATGYDAVRLADALSPDLVLLDLSLPDADGADMLFNLMDVAPGARVVVLSDRASIAGPGLVSQGATGFINKGLAPEELVGRLSAVLDVPLALVPAGQKAPAVARKLTAPVMQPKVTVETSVDSIGLDASTEKATSAGWGTGTWGTVRPLLSHQSLRAAIANGQLVAYYQPIVDLATGHAVGVEAVARWCTEDGRTLLPAEFIPLAESSGLIARLDESILAQATTYAASWNQRFAEGEPLFVSVNLSARQLVGSELVPLVARLLRESDLAPSLLHLEITETAIMDNVARSVVVLNDLRDLGISLSIDGFGTGYSSLACLQQLPVDVLKIDRCFVSGLASAKDTFIITAVLGMARALGMHCTAEGVQTTAQQSTLVELGCQFGQGPLWGRPMSPTEATSWAARRGH
jgi:EAL domain-containing protein (putative c-di-GMP-specific phosphodiesterase class I)/DNA-binding NarL/FixJ family response regulator